MMYYTVTRYVTHVHSNQVLVENEQAWKAEPDHNGTEEEQENVEALMTPNKKRKGGRTPLEIDNNMLVPELLSVHVLCCTKRTILRLKVHERAFVGSQHSNAFHLTVLHGAFVSKTGPEQTIPNEQ